LFVFFTIVLFVFFTIVLFEKTIQG
jgi:hypothetical protein